MIPEPIRGYVLVDVDSPYRERKYGSLILLVDPAFHPGENATYWGTAVSVPKKMGYFKGIDPIVEPGDKIYFDYKSINPEYYQNIVEHEGRDYYRVPYDYIFCVIRNGCITMVGDRVFCEAVYDADVEKIVYEGGETMGRKTASGLIKEINIEHNTKKAMIAHIGETDLDVAPGDVVHYEIDADDEYEIEGEKYFVMKQENLLVKCL